MIKIHPCEVRLFDLSNSKLFLDQMPPRLTMKILRDALNRDQAYKYLFLVYQNLSASSASIRTMTINKIPTTEFQKDDIFFVLISPKRNDQNMHFLF